MSEIECHARRTLAETDWLTVPQYAALKGVHPQTVRQWIRLGVVKAERTREPRGHWRLKRPTRAA